MYIANEIKAMLDEFANRIEVLAIAIGGSRSTGKDDINSDYDIYIYLENELNQDIRQKILEKYCNYIEIGNKFWELEDNCILFNAIHIDIVYRDLSQLEKSLIDVVKKGNSYNGFTTCLWHNLLTCEIIFDRSNKLKKLKDDFSIPYPKLLKDSIIKRNVNLLSGLMVSYDKQIEKSIKRKDFVNINNRIDAFLCSYFDIIYAINELPNSGEKRPVEICKENCKILPNNFEENINVLFFIEQDNIYKINEIIKNIVYELNKILNKIK